MSKSKIRFWAGIAFSVLGLVLALRSTNLEEAASVLGQVDYLPLVPALLALALTLLCKAARWRLLFDARYGHPPLSKAFTVLIIGQMVNLLFPLRMGEVARAYLIGEVAGSSRSLALATIVVEKAIDMLAVLLLIFLLVWTIPLPPWLEGPVLSSAIAGLALAIVLVAVAYQRERLSGLLARLISVVPAVLKPAFIRDRLERSLDGLATLRHPRTVLPVAVLTIISWLAAAVTNYFVFLSVGIELPFVASAFLLVVLQLGVAVPAGPGRIGVLQYLTILTLSLFAVAPERALATGVILYLLVHIPPIVMGLLFLWRHNLGLWRVGRLASGREA